MPGIPLLVAAALIVLFAYIIFGISGFGLGMITIPLLAHLFPLKFVIPVMSLLDCVGSIGMGLKLRGDVHRKELLPLLPFVLLGMIFGVYLLVRAPGAILLGCLGAFVLVYGVLYTLRREPVVRLARWTVAPLGIFAGAASAAFGIGGPLYVMYLTGRGATPEQIRATVPVIFIVTTVCRIGLLTAAGLITVEVLQTAGLLLPVMVLGLYVGNRLHGRLAREHVVRVVGGLLVVSGVSLILRAL